MLFILKLKVCISFEKQSTLYFQFPCLWQPLFIIYIYENLSLLSHHVLKSMQYLPFCLNYFTYPKFLY